MRNAATAAVLGIAAAVALVTCRRDSSAPAAPAVASAPSTPAMRPVEVASPEPRDRPAAPGGVAILAAAVRAQAVVVGILSHVESIDLHGWRAELQVDRTLLGPLRLGATVTIAWEELSAARHVRFGEGERVLVVLDALPTQSLWRKRFAGRSGPVLIVASGGDAFLLKPDGVTLDVLEHYLAMTADARDAAPGTERLAELVRRGHPAVAHEALALLEENPARADLLGADGTASLLAAARSPERPPALRAAALRLAARYRLPGAGETALGLIEPASPLRADAYRALAALPDGLSTAQVAGLLTDADPDLRVVALEVAGDHVDRERLATLARDDAAPAVRLAAGRALLARFRSTAVPEVLGLLDDSDPVVRNGIAETLGALGADAVAPLRSVVDGQSERAALAAVRGLAHAGAGGAATLASIADTHQNKSVRAFARLALGEAPGH